MLRLLIVLTLATFARDAAAADRPSDIRNYIFGNSLIHHLSSSDETTVPHWLHQLASAAGKSYAVDGQWGFLRNFAKDLPPIDQWSFKQVPGAWNREAKPFAQAGFNTIMINPANFIQYQSADRPYDGDNPNKETPLGAALALFDWLDGQQPGMTYYIYEGWSDMGRFSKNFPPGAAAIASYHAFNRGDYHAWYVDYLQRVKAARPKIDVQLIPVASVLSKLLTEGSLRDLKPADLYLDDAPHGTATTYFLAALITYTMMYDSKAPAGFTVPDTVHPLVKANYADIVNTVCIEVIGQQKCQ